MQSVNHNSSSMEHLQTWLQEQRERMLEDAVTLQERKEDVRRQEEELRGKKRRLQVVEAAFHQMQGSLKQIESGIAFLKKKRQEAAEMPWEQLTQVGERSTRCVRSSKIILTVGGGASSAG